jgi:hypothetical protein
MYLLIINNSDASRERIKSTKRLSIALGEIGFRQIESEAYIYFDNDISHRNMIQLIRNQLPKYATYFLVSGGEGMIIDSNIPWQAENKPLKIL